MLMNSLVDVLSQNQSLIDGKLLHEAKTKMILDIQQGGNLAVCLNIHRNSMTKVYLVVFCPHKGKRFPTKGPM